MSAADFVIKVGSTANILNGTLEDADEAPVPIQNAVVRWVMAPVAGGTAKVNAVADNLDLGTEETRGTVRYSWSAADLDTAGDYFGYWEVLYGPGQVIRFPEAGYLLIRVEAALA